MRIFYLKKGLKRQQQQLQFVFACDCGCKLYLNTPNKANMAFSLETLRCIRLVLVFALFILAIVYSLRAEFFVCLNFDMGTQENVTSFQASFYSSVVVI